MTPKQRDIVLIPVPFTDLSSVKRRPVLILSSDIHNRRSEDVVWAAITSRPTRTPHSTRINTNDLDDGTLRRESFVLADKIYTLNKAIVARRFGRLKADVFNQVLSQIDALWGR